MTAKDILKAATGPTIGTLKVEEQTNLFTAIVEILYTLKHLDPSVNKQRIALSADVLRDKVVERFPYLTIGEVKLALESGVYGEFGKDTILTPANLVNWVIAFTKLPERAEALKDKQSKDRIEARKTSNLLPPADKAARDEAFRKTAPLAAWEEFKRDPFYYEIYAIGYGHALYEALRSSGKMLQVTDQTLEEAKRRATIRYNRVHNESDPFAKVVNDAQALGHYVETELVKLYFRSLYDRGQNLTI